VSALDAGGSQIAETSVRLRLTFGRLHDLPDS